MEMNFFDIRVSSGEGVDFVFVVSHYVAQAGLELEVFMLSEYSILWHLLFLYMYGDVFTCAHTKLEEDVGYLAVHHFPPYS